MMKCNVLGMVLNECETEKKKASQTSSEGGDCHGRKERKSYYLDCHTLYTKTTP